MLKDEMGLSDEEAEILASVVQMIQSKPEREQPGHLGVILFTAMEDPQKCVGILLSLVKYTVDTFAIEGRKHAAALDIVEDLQSFADTLKESV